MYKGSGAFTGDSDREAPQRDKSGAQDRESAISTTACSRATRCFLPLLHVPASALPPQRPCQKLSGVRHHSLGFSEHEPNEPPVLCIPQMQAFYYRNKKQTNTELCRTLLCASNASNPILAAPPCILATLLFPTIPSHFTIFTTHAHKV